MHTLMVSADMEVVEVGTGAEEAISVAEGMAVVGMVGKTHNSLNKHKSD